MRIRTLRRSVFSAIVGAACAASGTNARAAIIHVDATRPGGSGTTWGGAYADLQLALAAASTGDEIWVAAGVYTPSDTDATASFGLSPDVALYGGFVGNESSRDQRDWLANETILSGDIGRDDVITAWPSGWDIVTANAGHVLVATGTNTGTVLDGFTIANGNTGPSGTPAGDPLMYGGGLYLLSGTPTIRNCKFTHNLAAFGSGGAIYCSGARPLIENCTFEQNYVHGGGGGAVLVVGNSTPVIRGCEFLFNVSVAISVSNLDGDAAGLGLYGDNPVTVSNCRFHGNLARSFYGIGDEIGYGGGLWVWNGGATIEGCVFTNNTATLGGGIMAWGPITVVNCLFQNNTATPQPNDPYPELGGDGAAIALSSAAVDISDIINCTVAYNHGKKYVGISAGWNAQFNLVNSIVRNNTASHPETAGTWKEQVNGFASLAYNNISHIFEPHGPGEDPLDPANMPGVIDADPLFVDPSQSGDLHLAEGSPCIDAGDNAALPPGTTVDLDGYARFVDDPATPDTGAGAAPIVDMGAYESQVGGTPPIPAVSQWGMAAMALILLTAATLAFRRQLPGTAS